MKNVNKGFSFWFRAGKMGEKQLGRAIEFLKDENIDFLDKGFRLDFDSNYTIDGIRDMLYPKGIVRYVIMENQ